MGKISQNFLPAAVVIGALRVNMDSLCLKNRVDPDKLASDKASWSRSTLFFITWNKRGLKYHNCPNKYTYSNKKTLSTLSTFLYENVICFLCLLHIYSRAIQTRFFFIKEAIIWGLIRLLPWEQSDLGPYCLQYRLAMRADGKSGDWQEKSEYGFIVFMKNRVDPDQLASSDSRWSWSILGFFKGYRFF